jgi:hypothetical protein
MQVGKDEVQVMRSLTAAVAPTRPALMALGRRYTITTVAVDEYGNELAAELPYPSFIIGKEFSEQLVQYGSAVPTTDQPGDGTTTFSFTFTKPGDYTVQVSK